MAIGISSTGKHAIGKDSARRNFNARRGAFFENPISAYDIRGGLYIDFTGIYREQKRNRSTDI